MSRADVYQGFRLIAHKFICMPEQVLVHLQYTYPVPAYHIKPRCNVRARIRAHRDQLQHLLNQFIERHVRWKKEDTPDAAQLKRFGKERNI